MNINNQLPIDEADFQKLIGRGKIYVDKTELIKNIIDFNGTYYFLSRPRRFGKSLLVSTFKNLFKGNKDLFKNTYIYDKWNWNDKYEVIHLDLSNPKAICPEVFEKSLCTYIDFIASDEFDFSLKSEFSNDKLRELISKVYKKNKKEVVVLIDEYDKPILDNIHKTKVATKIRNDILKDFYNILKSSNSQLRFVFITGITKFSKVSLFSELNNLIDLSLNKNYNDICGYNQEEVEKYFKKFIDNFSNLKNIRYSETIKKIKSYYDGYSWDGENFLYNPFSLMNFLNDKEFNNYWFESGTPNFLIKIFKENLNVENIFKPLILSDSEFKIFDIEKLKQIPLLYQGGYLTIVKKESINNKIFYTLKIPNNEVEESITENLFSTFISRTQNNFKNKKKEIYNEIKNGECDLLAKYLKTEIMKIPYPLKIRNWKYYQTVIYQLMNTIGFNSKSEISMFSGRLDIAVEEEDSYYPFADEIGNIIIIEVKYTQNKNMNLETLSTKALKQIKDKGYHEIYEEENNITIIGLAIKEIQLKLGGSKIDLKCKIEKI